MSITNFLENIDQKIIVFGCFGVVCLFTLKTVKALNNVQEQIKESLKNLKKDNGELIIKKKSPTEFEKVLNYISIADSYEINKILNTCVENKNIIIPNWYTWYDLMELTGEPFSSDEWLQLHSKSEDLSDQLNALIVQWYEQFNGKFKKITNKVKS